MQLVTLVDLLLAAVSGGIVAVHLALYAGIVRVRFWKRSRRRAVGTPPTVTIVVPARNEAAHLPALFASLESQSTQDFTVVFIDDRSTDRTPELLADFAKRHAGRVRIVHIDGSPQGDARLNPKQRALAVGCREVTGEVILFTDADCTVPRRWVEESARFYLDPRIGLVIGAIITRQDRGHLSRYHAFDHIFKYAYTAGSVGIGMATGGFGNNLSIRSAALADVGGYESIGFSTTEDAALIAAVRTRTKWKVRALFDRSTLVVTDPLIELAAMAAQEVRWHIGGLFSSDPGTRLSYGYLMLYLTASVIVLPFIPLHLPLALLPITSFATMGGMALAAGLGTRQGFLRYWLPFLPNLLFTMGFNSYLTVRAFVSRRVVWKGNRL